MFNIRATIARIMSNNNSKRYVNTADCAVPIEGKYRRNIISIAKGFFRIGFRKAELNRDQWRFDVHVVDADAQTIKDFLEECPMCHVENTFREIKVKEKVPS